MAVYAKPQPETVVFVGDARFSPGLEHREVYARLTEPYVNAFERLGVPVHAELDRLS